MSNYKLVSPNKHGGISITTPSLKWLEANSYNYKKLAEKLKLKSYKIVNVKDLPVDRKFRNAWKLNPETSCVECCPDVLRASIKADLYKEMGKLAKDDEINRELLRDKIKSLDSIKDLEGLKEC